MDMLYTIFGGRPPSSKPASDVHGKPINLNTDNFDRLFGAQRPVTVKHKPSKKVDDAD